MLRIKSISVLLLAALFLTACQLFEPLPTLPPVLTLEPLASEAVAGGTQQNVAPVTAETKSASPTAATQSTADSPTPSATRQPATPTPAPSQTQPVAPSATSQPTNLPAATATRPAATAAENASWHDVPIMPGATQGGEEAGAYSYTVSASVAQVQRYYEQIMPLSGWAPFASGEGEAGNLLLMFSKGNTTATIGILNQDGGTLVLIVAE